MKRMETGPWEASGEAWRALVDCLSDGVAVVDPSGVQCFVNRALCQMLGYERHELLGAKPPFCYWPEEHRESIDRVFQGALTGAQADAELVLKRKNGERFFALVHPGVVSSMGQIVGYVAIVKDVSDRRRMEQALRWSEQRWRSVAENPFDFVVTIDRDYRFTYVNHTVPGVRAEDLIGKATPFDYIDRKHHGIVRDVCERAFRDAEPGSYEIYAPSLRRWYSTVVGPIVEEGVVTGASMLTRDVTPQKTAEQALRQAQRMEALGRLAGGIAHDFNNLLVPILGNAELLQRRLTTDAPAKRFLEDIVQAAERAKELVSRILLFGREPAQELEAVRLQELVHEVARFIRAGAPPTVCVETSVDDRCDPVLAVPGELHQVVSNLCTNAVQALGPEGGILKLTLSSCELPAETRQEDASRTQASLPEADPGARFGVRLVVEDTGPGIAEHVQSRIFDPFFTTRPVGQGTGLGLSIVQAIVTRYGGTVSFENVAPSGARFTVLLPAERTSSGPARRGVPRTEQHAQALRLVCVDDQSLVLRWLTQTLERAGHTVRAFDDPSEAARFLEAHATDVDCVISDETMPGLTGTELARRLQERAPSLPVLLVSGYALVQAGAVPENVKKRLPKPIDAASLLEAVRGAVGEASSVLAARTLP